MPIRVVPDEREHFKITRLIPEETIPGERLYTRAEVKKAMQLERKNILRETTIATYLALVLAAAVAITMRRQQFYQLEWYWTSIVSICVFALCHRFGRIMFRRKS